MVIFSSSRHSRALFWCVCAIRDNLSDGVVRQLNTEVHGFGYYQPVVLRAEISWGQIRLVYGCG